MRVISGLYRGHHLKSFSADHIRPTMDRVKESLFNILQNDVEDAVVADLFCGTGSLGIEALSRGAKHVTFVDLHPKSLQITTENLKLLKIPESSYKIVKKDVFRWFAASVPNEFSIVFADPPFTEKWADKILQTVEQTQFLQDNCVFIIEAIKQEKLEKIYGSIFCEDLRDFGDKSLSFFRKKADNDSA